jgi:hypothetical protein
MAMADEISRNPLDRVYNRPNIASRDQAVLNREVAPMIGVTLGHDEAPRGLSFTVLLVQRHPFSTS